MILIYNFLSQPVTDYPCVESSTHRAIFVHTRFIAGKVIADTLISGFPAAAQLSEAGPPDRSLPWTNQTGS